MNALLNNDVVIMDKDREIGLNIEPSYENYYEKRLNSFKGGDVQLNLHEKSSYECEIADMEIQYE